jgi:uncharacterized protein (TIGR03067 family)
MREIGLFGLLVLAVLFVPAAAGEKTKLDPAKLVGTWTFVSGEKEGKKISTDNLKKGVIDLTKDVLTMKFGDEKFVIKYSVDATKSPARIKMEITEGPQGQGSKAEGIIALKGDQLQLCYPAMGGATPDTFMTKEGSGLHLFTLERKK